MLVLEKIFASFFSLPGLFILIWLLITIYLIKTSRSYLIKLVVVITLIMMLVTFTGLGTRFLVYPLENTYQERSYTADYPIVILGGGLNYGQGSSGAELSAISLQRLVKGYILYTRVGGPIIFSCGIGIGHQGISGAEVAFNWLRKMGVPEEELIMESRSRTTYENGYYVQKWLNANGYEDKVYLVTSALHLPRSMMVFYKQGIRAIPVPAGYLISHQMGWYDYLPSREALNANLSAIHEWVGILWYRLRDRI